MEEEQDKTRLLNRKAIHRDYDFIPEVTAMYLYENLILETSMEPFHPRRLAMIERREVIAEKLFSLFKDYIALTGAAEARYGFKIFKDAGYSRYKFAEMATTMTQKAALLFASDSFTVRSFPQSFGGKAWKTIIDCALEKHAVGRYQGSKNLMLVDTIISMEHNTNNIFNKQMLVYSCASSKEFKSFLNSKDKVCFINMLLATTSLHICDKQLISSCMQKWIPEYLPAFNPEIVEEETMPKIQWGKIKDFKIFVNSLTEKLKEKSIEEESIDEDKEIDKEEEYEESLEEEN